MTRREALEILGLDSDASLDDARNAYRTLARTYHPDKNSAPNATAMFRIIRDAYEFILNNDSHQQTEVTTQQKQAEAEVARKRAQEESARRRAETEAQRKGAEEFHRRAQEEVAQKVKEKAELKNARNFCIALFLINLVLTSAIMVELDQFDKTNILDSMGELAFHLLLGSSINSLIVYWAFRLITNDLIDPNRFDTDGKKPLHGKKFIAVYAIYTIVYVVYTRTTQDGLSTIIGNIISYPALIIGMPIPVIFVGIASLIIIILVKFLKWLVSTIRRRK